MNRAISKKLFPVSLTNSKYYLVLFLLWPFLAFLLAIKNYNHKEARKVVYIFLIYYGLTFVIDNTGIDAYRIAMRLINYAALSLSEFFDTIGGLYTSEGNVDIYELLVSFVISRITSHHNLLFAVYAAVYGFFYLKSINLLYDRDYEKPDWNAMFIIAFFATIMPITAISGVRFYTAAWIFFYGAYHVVLYRDARYLIVSLSASLVHFSYLSANAVLIIYFIAGNRNFIYLPLAITSFVLPQLFASTFRSISMSLGGALQSRYDMYSGEYYVIARQQAYEQVAWFMKISDDLVLYFLLLSIIVIQIKFKHLMEEKAERNLFSFSLLFLSFVNFGKIIPSFGGRFQALFFLLALLYIFHFILKLNLKRINWLTWLGLFPMLLLFAIRLRQGSETINAWIFAPVFGLPLFAPSMSLAYLLFY